MDFLVAWLALVTGWCAVKVVRLHVRQRFVHNLLHDDQPERFLAEMEKDIEACGSNSRMRGLLVINKSAGFCYLGRFEEAAALLKNVDTRELPSTFQSLYCNNYLITLLQLRRFDEARKFVADNRRHLQPETRHRDVDNAMRGTLAIFELMCGDRERGKSELASLLKLPCRDYLRAWRLYSLGVALLEEGRREEAIDNLRLASSVAPPHCFIPNEVHRLVGAR